MKKLNDGDTKAWAHAIASGRFAMLDSADLEQLTFMLLVGKLSRGEANPVVQQSEVDAVASWASDARMNAALLDNVLLRSAMVFVDEKGQVSFALTSQGTAEAERIAESIGLPIGEDDDAGPPSGR